MATNGIYEAEVYRAAPYKLFQKFCDEIFGEGAVVVKEAAGNPITGCFKFVDACTDFKENLRQRLVCLRDKFVNSIYYQVLLSQVGLLADPVQWEKAYAKLAAYDILWNNFVFESMRLRRIGLVTHTYAKETGVKEKKTENFGYLSDADKEFYFNADLFGDTIGSTMKWVVDLAIRISKQQGWCEVYPEYPWDDNADVYVKNKNHLLNELTEILKPNNTKTEGGETVASKIVPQLTYKIHWGESFYFAMNEFETNNPYRFAEKTKDLLFKRCVNNFMKKGMYVQVLVRAPWYDDLLTSFKHIDETYYRALARRTFCGYLNDPTPMKTSSLHSKGRKRWMRCRAIWLVSSLLRSI